MAKPPSRFWVVLRPSGCLHGAGALLDDWLIWGDTPPERRLSSHASLVGLDKRRGRGISGGGLRALQRATTHPPRPLRRAAGPASRATRHTSCSSLTHGSSS